MPSMFVKYKIHIKNYMAGVAGFEPTNDGIKNRCLTTWRHPNHLMDVKYSITDYLKKQEVFISSAENWRAWRDSNSRPSPSEGDTLSS